MIKLKTNIIIFKKAYYYYYFFFQDGVGDANDFWEVDVDGGKPGDPVRTVSSLVRFRHIAIGCYLHSHSKQLPKWLVN